MDAERRFKVGRLVEIVLKALTKRMTVGPDKIRFHFRLADHAVPDTHTHTHTYMYQRYIVGKVHCGENPCVLVGRCGERTHTHTHTGMQSDKER